MNADLVVVGSGLFGLTVAERAANELGLDVAIIDRRHHIDRKSTRLNSSHRT